MKQIETAATLQTLTLATLGFIQGAGKEIVREIAQGSTQERIEATALAVTLGAVAIAGYGIIKGSHDRV